MQGSVRSPEVVGMVKRVCFLLAEVQTVSDCYLWSPPPPDMLDKAVKCYPERQDLPLISGACCLLEKVRHQHESVKGPSDSVKFTVKMEHCRQ